MSVNMCVSECANEGQRATLGRQPSILFETGSLVGLCVHQAWWPSDFQGCSCLHQQYLSRSFGMTDTCTTVSNNFCLNSGDINLGSQA